MVVVLCTASYDAYGNTCIKFYEHILNSFKVVERTWFCHRTANYKVQKDVTQKVSIQELWFLQTAHRLILVNICMYFHEDMILSQNC